MMWKIYYRQAIQMLKQNLFISIISILGTAAAIMMIMAIIVSDEIRSVNIAPEINRSLTLYVPTQSIRDTVRSSQNNNSLTYDIVHNYISRLQQPRYKGIVSSNEQDKATVLNTGGSQDYINGVVRAVNAGYWSVLSFDFLAGKPFTSEEVASGVRHAVLSESTAKRLLKDQEAIGQQVDINFQPHTVVGVVKDIEPLFKHAYGEAWVPYTSDKKYQTHVQYEALLLATSTDDFPGIIAEIRECERQFGQENKHKVLTLKGPFNRQIYNMELHRSVGFSPEEIAAGIKQKHRKRVFIICVLLLIPAVNLSGLSLSRIKKRTSEIGVRKAFGAKKYIILIQVLYENFITSLIGGVLGLLLSYAVVFWMRGWLLHVPAGGAIPVSTLVSPYIFLVVFLACLVINLLSSGLPAFRASRATIIQSLNQNEKQP